MDEAFQRAYLETEHDHWWTCGRRDVIVRLLAELHVSPDAAILDVGCSGGPLLAALAAEGYSKLHGVDASGAAVEHCHRLGFADVQQMDAGELELDEASFQVLIASDVLEHLDDQQAALRSWRRVLTPGGLLLVFVPAYRLLWSEHDELNQHRRRYRLGELAAQVRQAGFEVVRRSYWNVSLLAPIAMVRLLGRLWPGGTPPSTVALPRSRGLPNRVLAGLLAVENRLLAGGLDAPFGVSAFVVAQSSGATFVT